MRAHLKVFTVVCSFLFLLAVAAAGQQRLLVIGGGERPPEAMKRFAAWSGGPQANVLIITWASGAPDESFASLSKQLTEAGAGTVVHAPIRPLDAAKRAEFITMLERATGIFFSGGDQNRIMEVLGDDELFQKLHAKYRSGTPFGGTSAGAAVMSDPMMTGEADLKLLDGKKVGVRKGLGLLPNVIFDQHFLVRQRHNRLFGLIIENPKMLGIGIDEDTAVLVEDNRRLTVNGKTHVLFVGSSGKPGKFTLHILGSSEKFDLRRQKIVR